MRRVLRQVITGLVSILLDAILRSSGGGGGGWRRAAGGRAGGGRRRGRAGRGGGACLERPRERAAEAVRVHERAPRRPSTEGAVPGSDCACCERCPPWKAGVGSDPQRRSGPWRRGRMGEPGGSVRGQGGVYQTAVTCKFLLRI